MFKVSTPPDAVLFEHLITKSVYVDGIEENVTDAVLVATVEELIRV